MENQDCNSIQPFYQFSQPNEETLLAEGRATVKVSDKVYTGDGKVYLRLLPRPRIEIRIGLHNTDFTCVAHFIDDAREGSVQLERRNVISGFATQVTWSSEKGTTLVWVPKQEPVGALGDDNTLIRSVVFHLFNFENIIGTSRSTVIKTVGNTLHWIWIEHLNLTSEDWQVKLCSLPSTRETFKILEEQGGFGLTHVGCFEKADRSQFSGKEAKELLDALRFFFSFAKGMWCGPVCAVGFDDSGTRVWELWSSPDTPWHSSSSWFDPRHCEQLVKLFPAFMKKWKDEGWREALREAIYWYLRANDSSWLIDEKGGIILAQAAIERLSYEKERRSLSSKNKFRKTPASYRLRRLFSSLDIPIDLPDKTDELRKLKDRMNWRDAPDVLKEIRNSVVHPEREVAISREAYCEAWKLLLWYLELSILGICGYAEKYMNRLRWEMEEVPWEK